MCVDMLKQFRDQRTISVRSLTKTGCVFCCTELSRRVCLKWTVYTSCLRGVGCGCPPGIQPAVIVAIILTSADFPVFSNKKCLYLLALNFKQRKKKERKKRGKKKKKKKKKERERETDRQTDRQTGGGGGEDGDPPTYTPHKTVHNYIR